MPQAKPVNLYCTNAFKIEGRHVEVNEVVFDVEPELAKELAGAGRVRLATDAEVAKAKKAAAKAEAPAA